VHSGGVQFFGDTNRAEGLASTQVCGFPPPLRSGQTKNLGRVLRVSVQGVELPDLNLLPVRVSSYYVGTLLGSGLWANTVALREEKLNRGIPSYKVRHGQAQNAALLSIR
jgi:hypothetical protein